MGKGSRNRNKSGATAAKRSARAGGDQLSAELVSALRDMRRASETVRAAAKRFEAVYNVQIEELAIPFGSSDPTPVEEFGEMLREVRELIDGNAPISPNGVKGYRWEPPLTIKKLFLYAEVAEPTDPSYRDAARLNTEFSADRARKIEAAAERGCSVSGCRLRAVYVPVDDAANTCWRHLDGEEAYRVLGMYDAAVATLACPGCVARAGVNCSEESSDLRLVDGRWPRIRKVQGHNVHKERLDLWQRNKTAQAD